MESSCLIPVTEHANPGKLLRTQKSHVTENGKGLPVSYGTGKNTNINPT